jgi:hypothetical protein
MISFDRRHVLVVVLAVLVVAAGCSGAGGGADGPAGDGGDGGGAGDGGDGGDGGDAGDGGDGGYEGTIAEESAQGGDGPAARDLRERMRIRTGSIDVQVESYADARENVTRAVRRLGGFVSDSNREVHGEDNRTWVTGRLVVRVPQDNFSDAMTRIERVGNVTRSSTHTKDVTDQLVDIGARLENLRAQREKLRELYDRANETEDLLAIQERLSQTQERIERLEAERQSLRDRVAYSTITIDLAEPEPEPPEPTTASTVWHQTGIVTALQQSVSGVATTLRAIVVLLAYATPYLLTFGLPIALVAGAVRRYRRGSNRPESDDGSSEE